MQIVPVLYSEDMQATLDFYVPLGFEARDVLQEGDAIKSMQLIYKENDLVKIIFREGKPNPGAISIQIEEADNEVPDFQIERYGGAKEEQLTDPNGYKVEFVKN